MIKRTTWQMRLTDDDEEVFSELEQIYGIDRTSLVRHLLRFAQTKKPEFKITPIKKSLTPSVN